ncbi:hypothetical protein A2673_02345 [Candidatus Kaiserbacteria bacterium RIFCSPHIGHO2_01_FULL_50_13]|uniref:Uncharacterized protein n=1 Tax=Candidatus Kaiserbacteria bacterium RIFCSPLOWO2_01_FULL_50_24 TaxID=1798507 RepID=A0A1F6EQY1_9BACT|nr:MAG: hypothetical protein A2673_02345 [Candidatus Kaiserbacteria bacterium RIFCSPHIGHO2_01_FULL_50_13]OGG76034.1 MAG: hypothetical protein A3A34_00070 [Candidatus Kaiserbacteria bacterium RIFCSPLOWO2_01_FULL_50_24]OGG82040.1 MAG: hypothetical protein A3H74_03485 [Candidatus Kaiserbacteria bacterium RIFCSPLOWO2_02_FULL_51_13]
MYTRPGDNSGSWRAGNWGLEKAIQILWMAGDLTTERPMAILHLITPQAGGTLLERTHTPVQARCGASIAQ